MSVVPWKAIRFLKSWKFCTIAILGFGIRTSAQGIGKLTFRIGIRNPFDSTDKESGVKYLKAGIHILESTIQDCLELRYVGRFVPLHCTTIEINFLKSRLLPSFSFMIARIFSSFQTVGSNSTLLSLCSISKAELVKISSRGWLY